jgi:cardiolipin synthase
VSEYRVKDLILVPNLLSGARVPLAVAFPLAAGNAPLALGILGFAGLSDVLDGWAARKLGQATPMGALVDGVADKVFAASVLGTLVATGMLTPIAALLLATRELGELPLAVRVLTSKRARLTEIDRKANRLGKIATVLEFATVLAVVAAVPGKNVLLAATAVCGAAAAASYWMREVRAVRQEQAVTAPSHRTPSLDAPSHGASSRGRASSRGASSRAPQAPLPLRVAPMMLPPPSSRAPSSVAAPI